MKYVEKRYHEKTEVMPGFFLARVDAPSAFVNQSLRALNVRQAYGVDILLVRRQEGGQERDFLPAAGDVLRPTDQLLVFGERHCVEQLCQTD